MGQTNEGLASLTAWDKFIDNDWNIEGFSSRHGSGWHNNGRIWREGSGSISRRYPAGGYARGRSRFRWPYIYKNSYSPSWWNYRYWWWPYYNEYNTLPITETQQIVTIPESNITSTTIALGLGGFILLGIAIMVTMKE